MAFFQEAHGCESGKQPGKFGNLWHVRLPKEYGFLRVKAAREKIEGNIKGVSAAFRGIKQGCHGMIVGDEVKRLAPFLQLDSGFHHPKIIPKVKRAGGLDA